MTVNKYRLAAISVAIVSLTMLVGGCDSSSSSGPDMDELASRLNPPKPAPVPEQPPAPAPAPVERPAAPAQTSATALPGGIVTSADPDDLARRPSPQPQAAPPAAAPQPAADTPPPHVPAVSRGEGDVVGKRVYTNKVGGVLRYYGAIASARNFMEDRILDAQIQKTLQLYVANNDGKFPKTNDEYMEHIIKEGMIQLPELPPGQEYFYDPSDHELKVGTLVELPTDAAPPADAQPPAAAPAERR
jgi:hypothetical protein